MIFRIAPLFVPQLLAGQGDKARRIAERARMREEKRKQAEDEVEMKRSSLLATLKDKVQAAGYLVVALCQGVG